MRQVRRRRGRLALQRSRLFLLPIPPQHEFPLLGELGFDGFVELGCVLGAGEVPILEIGNGAGIQVLDDRRFR